MTRTREPNLETLLNGDLIARSPLTYERLRSQLLEMLHDRLPAYSQRSSADAGMVLIDTLAAALDVVGFYHDRILTETKVGAARRLVSIQRLGEQIGFVPLPAIAARTLQFFEAATPGLITAGSRIAGTSASGRVVFSTSKALTIGPAFNSMPIVPLITRYAGSDRAILVLSEDSAGSGDPTPPLNATPETGSPSPLDDYICGLLAMVYGVYGLELVTVEEVRRRAVAFTSGLRRSYDRSTTFVNSVAFLRQLRFRSCLEGQVTDDTTGEVADVDTGLVAFEVSPWPVLHVPDAKAPGGLRSSLALYVFDPTQDTPEPSQWSTFTPWEEVADFSASEAADHHYRTFVDDRLFTYLAVRRTLGARRLLSEQQLDSCYVRGAPAVGSLVSPEGTEASFRDLSAVTIPLSMEYFTAAPTTPTVKNGLPCFSATALVTDRVIQVAEERQILIENQKTSDRYIRTLTTVSERYLSWSPGEQEEENPATDKFGEPLWTSVAKTLASQAASSADPDAGPSPSGEDNGLPPLETSTVQEVLGPYFELDTSFPVEPGRSVQYDAELYWPSALPDAHETISANLPPGATSVVPLADAASGTRLGFWEAFYRQVEVPAWSWKMRSDFDDLKGREDDLRPDDVNLDSSQLDQVIQTTVVPVGSIFLMVQDTSLIKPGDFFLIGKRVRDDYRSETSTAGSETSTENETSASGNETGSLNGTAGNSSASTNSLNATTGNSSASTGSASAPTGTQTDSSSASRLWLTAEVVQAIEVQGPLVRLKHPTANAYTLDFFRLEGTLDASGRASDLILGDAVTEILAIPLVASVYFGDFFVQRLRLTPDLTFVSQIDAKKEFVATAWEGEENPPIESTELLETLWADVEPQPSDSEDPDPRMEVIWNEALFLAVSSQYLNLAVRNKLFAIRFWNRGMEPGDVFALRTIPADGSSPVEAGLTEYCVPVSSPGGTKLEVEPAGRTAFEAVYMESELDARLQGLVWGVEGSDPAPAAVLRIQNPGGWQLFTTAELLGLSGQLPASGAQLCLWWYEGKGADADVQRRYPYRWDAGWVGTGLRLETGAGTVEATNPWEEGFDHADGFVITGDDHRIDLTAATIIGRWTFTPPSGLSFEVERGLLLLDWSSETGRGIAAGHILAKFHKDTDTGAASVLVLEGAVSEGQTTPPWSNVGSNNTFQALSENTATFVTDDCRSIMNLLSPPEADPLHDNIGNVALRWRNNDGTEVFRVYQAARAADLISIDIEPQDGLEAFVTLLEALVLPNPSAGGATGATITNRMVTRFSPSTPEGDPSELSVPETGRLRLSSWAGKTIASYEKRGETLVTEGLDTSLVQEDQDQIVALFDPPITESDVESDADGPKVDDLQLIDATLDEPKPLAWTWGGKLLYARVPEGEYTFPLTSLRFDSYTRAFGEVYFLEGGTLDLSEEGDIETFDLYGQAIARISGGNPDLYEVTWVTHKDQDSGQLVLILNFNSGLNQVLWDAFARAKVLIFEDGAGSRYYQDPDTITIQGSGSPKQVAVSSPPESFTKVYLGVGHWPFALNRLRSCACITLLGDVRTAWETLLDPVTCSGSIVMTQAGEWETPTAFFMYSDATGLRVVLDMTSDALSKAFTGGWQLSRVLQTWEDVPADQLRNCLELAFKAELPEGTSETLSIVLATASSCQVPEVVAAWCSGADNDWRYYLNLEESALDGSVALYFVQTHWADAEALEDRLRAQVQLTFTFPEGVPAELIDANGVVFRVGQAAPPPSLQVEPPSAGSYLYYAALEGSVVVEGLSFTCRLGLPHDTFITTVPAETTAYFALEHWSNVPSSQLGSDVLVQFNDPDLTLPEGFSEYFSSGLFEYSDSPFVPIDFLSDVKETESPGRWQFRMGFEDLFDSSGRLRYDRAWLVYHAWRQDTAVEPSDIWLADIVVDLENLPNRSQPELTSGDNLTLLYDSGSKGEFRIEAVDGTGPRKVTLDHLSLDSNIPELFDQVALEHLRVTRTAYLEEDSSTWVDLHLTITLDFGEPPGPFTPPFLFSLGDLESPGAPKGLVRYVTPVPSELDAYQCATFELDVASLQSLLPQYDLGTAKLFVNQKDALDERFYLYTEETSLYYTAFETQNFLIAGNEVTQLAVVYDPDGVSPISAGDQIMFADFSSPPLYERLEGFVRTVAGATDEAMPVAYLSASIAFNTGNFIPVRNNAADPTSDQTIISNALTVLVADTSNATRQLKGHAFTYNPQSLSLALTSPTETYEEDGIPQFYYSFNKTPGDVFSLNFLVFFSTASDECADLDIDIYVRYQARIVPEDSSDPKPRKYAFATHVQAWNPLRQILLQEPGELKAGELLFLTKTNPAAADLIQWTRIRKVDGRLLLVEPSLLYEPRSFIRYQLNMLRKVAKPAKLDEDYYTGLSRTELEVDPLSNASVEFNLELGDRVVLDFLDPVAAALLRTLVPGDRLLIWDERWRAAWYQQRTGGTITPPEQGSAAPPSSTWEWAGDNSRTANWWEWLDYQIEAVVKTVDAGSGLIVLAEPLPPRFYVKYSYTPPAEDPSAGTVPSVAACRADVSALRVLPYYRWPFQGERTLSVLGSGDRSRKFARYTTEISGRSGLASLPLPVQGTFASNLEVLAVAPRSNEWSRWTEYADLDNAGKTPAYELGVTPVVYDHEPGTSDKLPRAGVSVTFGDGINGERLATGKDNVFLRVTTIGPRDRHIPQRRELAVLAAGSGGLPFDVADPPTAGTNAFVEIEFGAYVHWRPTAGRQPWQSAMTLELWTQEEGRPAALSLRFQEVSEAEAQEGYDGFVAYGLRPGVVRVWLSSREAIEGVTIGPACAYCWRAFEEPQSRTWSLDSSLYAGLEENDPSLRPGATALVVKETEGLSPESLLAFETGNAQDSSELVEVEAVDPDTWTIALATPLERTYDVKTAILRGNLVEAVQGDIQQYVIGSGDGRTADLRLPLYNRQPLLHSLDEGSSDPTPLLEIRVDGQPWTLVSDLEPCGPRDRVFRTEVQSNGDAFVVFGDGQRGAIPFSGKDNIVAKFHSGGGGDGNVAAGTLNKLLDGNLAVAKTRNATSASGGREAETVDEARDRLLGGGPRFSRIVSAGDAERVALEDGDVLQARLDPTAPADVVRLTIALTDGRTEMDDAIRESLTERLLALMPATAGVTLELQDARQVPVYLVICVSTLAGYSQAEVKQVLEVAFDQSEDGFFAPERWPIGEPLRLGDVYEWIFRVPGVRTARVRWMSTSRPGSTLPVSAPDTVSPGFDGVICCENDRLSDPYQRRGTVVFVPVDADT